MIMIPKSKEKEFFPDGKIAWEMKFDSTPEIRTSIYQSERFLEVPLIEITRIIDPIKEGENLTIDLSV